MTEQETIKRLDSELLALMLVASDFICGKATLRDLQEAEERAEKFRSLTQY